MNNLIEQISYWQDEFPEDSLAQIIDQEEQAKPLLRTLLSSAIKHYKELPEEYVGHIFALYLLAYFRDKESFKQTLDILKLPEPYPKALLSDFLYQSFPQVIASCYADDPLPLFEVIGDRSINYLYRVVALVAVTILVNRKTVSRKVVADFLLSQVESQDPKFLASIAQEVADMHLGELYDPIKALYAQNCIDEEQFSKKLFDTMFQSEYSNPNKFFLIDDIFEELNGKEYSGS